MDTNVATNASKIREKETFPLVDILKFFFATIVIAVHVFAEYSTLGWLNQTLSVLTQVGMAFFFIASGFFSYRKFIKTGDHVVFLRQSLRLLILYGFYNVLYYIVRVLAPALLNKTTLLEPTLDFVKNMLVGGTSVMWFIWSLIIINLLMFFLTWKSRNPFHLAVIVSAFAFAFYVGFSVIFDSYGALFLPSDTYTGIITHWTYFGLIRLLGRGIPFVSAGYLVSVLPGFYRRKSVIISVLLLSAASFVVEYLLSLYFGGYGVCYGVTMLPFIVFGFKALVSLDNIEPKPIFKLMRNASTAIYLIHTPIMNLMHQVFKFEYIPKAEGLLPFLSILLLSLIYFALLYWLKRFKAFRFAGYLY